MALAAEFKRASPSKGDIAVHLDAGEQAQKYASAGANIISVLTEPRYFKGGLDDMTSVRLQTTNQSYQRPAVLRKEFTTSTYQITEAEGQHASLFSRPSPHNFCYVSVDPTSRHVRLWYSAWFPMM